MESGASKGTILPPWQHPHFLTEEGLRAAQEYYFQTHATQSRAVAQARSAQGVSKTLLRRKLSREMGEDFKMYTGTAVGETTAPEEMASLGIRGELNALLKHIYMRIAPTQPITSPTQEDVTILKHPYGALEVCYAMVFYYNSLMRQYASFAANRRKVLKSIMDEEMFKWVWRMVLDYMMMPEEAKLTAEPPYLSAGLAFIPVDKQRIPLGAKLYEIGMFLLSKAVQESHLRVPLCHYYSTYLRQMQTLLALHTGRQELDEVYSAITRRAEGEPADNPLVAIDGLLNGKGSSMEAFDDVLKDEAQLTQYIPPAEVSYINQFEDFGNPQRLAATLKRLVPDTRREVIDGEETSLMPLLLTLRGMQVGLRAAVLGALSVPLLILVRNRISNVPQDDVARVLLEELSANLESRRGESYTVRSSTGGGRAAVASSVRVAPPKGAGEQPAARTAVAPPAEAAARPAAKPRVAPAAAPSAQPAAKPAPAAPAPRGGAAPARPAASHAAPGAAPAAAAREGAAAGAPRVAYLEEPSLLAWRLDGERVAAISLSARELFALVGGEPRFLVPWVVFTLRTGQVFGLAPERVSKERVEQIVHALRRQAGEGGGELPPEQLAALLEQAAGASHAKLLLSLLKLAGTQRFLRTPGALVPGLAALSARFGAGLLDFLRNPAADAFRGQREGLTPEERQAVVVLQRVARAQ